LNFSASNFNINRAITISSRVDLVKIPDSKRKSILVLPTSDDLRGFFKIIKKKKKEVEK